ncbi:YjcQ family protein [Aedoeadaptatus acetigenes]|uniref:YjcQ family protein n=1 Tax=Aedoeadaptatus acetigenes TaxID=2981723 RepID=UPI0011DD86D3|nr:YjcQ family protein [Aedoeadaptatus acetigenes]MCU6786407.1 YjcQ family protein [Aedoeadaptatus acetigenes]
MIEDFKIIYTILSTLQSSLDYPKVDVERLSAEYLEINKHRRDHLLEMLVDAGYIKGVQVRRYEDGSYLLMLKDVQITLKGLEYLEENSILRRVQRELKGIKETIPGL